MRLIPIAAICLLPAVGAAQPAQLLHTFTRPLASPDGGLLPLPDGSFYGVASTGLIRLSSAGQVTQVVRLPDSTAEGPLVRASDGALYGVTVAGGSANQGTVFRFDSATERLRILHAFSSPAGGSHPFGGLVPAGGALYGVTARGPGGTGANAGGGTIFRVDVATGAVVTEVTFQAAALPSPAGPLALGPDGRLYGVTSGNAIYAFDPGTRTLAPRATLNPAVGTSAKSLTLGGDGRLYGGAAAGGAEGRGTIFRYTPATNAVELVYSVQSNGVDGRAPGPLFQAADGHFYGATTRASDGSVGGTLFRLRAGAGGTFTFEPLRQLGRFVDGSPWNSVLTQGADGLIYGSATSGPTGSGTLFRFDPLASGPPPDPLAFTVLHTFPCTGSWFPSSGLTLAPDGLLYGTTDFCGASFRGAVYRVAPTTGQVTFLGDIPGAPSGQQNSALVAGPDGRLYGTSTAYASPNFVTSIMRADPSTGAVTVAVGAVTTPSASDPVRTGLVRSSSGQIFGVRRETSAYVVYRFDPAADTVSTAATLTAESLSDLVALAGGDVVAVAQFLRSGGTGVPPRSALVRLNAAAPSGYEELAPDLAAPVGIAVVGVDGHLYGGASAPAALVQRVHPATGAVSTACTLPAAGTPFHLSVAGDGAIHGVLVEGGIGRQVFRCQPATGAVELTTLPPDIGVPIAPMALVGDVFYGVSHGRPGLQLGDRAGGSIFQLAGAGATLTPIDSDGDALPNAWETLYGLDPFDSGHGSGPADDPDGDGRTNAEELADGTHPRGVVTRLFAEGAANAFFRTRFDLANASIADSAIVRARFLADTGATVATTVVVPRLGHLGVDPSAVPGMPPGSFSAIFESDTATAVDRTMSWDGTGYGSHLETGIAAPSTTWYFAEGSTSGDFSLFYLLQNPQATTITATVRYLRPFGQTPIDRTYTLPPTRRTTIVVDTAAPELASTDVSAVITATGPIVAERAMYVNRPGQPFAAGHGSAGVTAPAFDWFLAEGATGAFFDLFVLIANPSTNAANVSIEYLRSSGPPLVKTYVVPAQSRITIWVDDEQLPAGSGQKPLAHGSVSTSVHVTNGVPVIVERAMWWPGPETTSDFWYEAHNSPGATGVATRWLIGGAAVLGADAADAFVLIANTADRVGQATLHLLADGEGSFSAPLTIDLAPKSRTTVSLASHVPASATERWYGVLIESTGADPVPIVVERANYASPGGVFWARGGNALASPLP